MAFAHARDFTIGENAQFNVIENQTNIYRSDNRLIGTNVVLDILDPFKDLLGHCAIEATQDSVTASYAPTCHPDTRKAVTNDITAWAVDDPTHPRAVSITWLSGPAGAGKSCIQRKVVEICQDKGVFAASFFFSTHCPNTRCESYFITTIAAQLTETTPQVKPFVLEAIENDPAIFRKSLEAQMEALIIGPFSLAFPASCLEAATGSLPRVNRNVVVIDGLDECMEEKEQVHILSLIQKLTRHPSTPFRFIVASRPEYSIRTAFATPPLASICRNLRLERYKADSDIRCFLEAEFARLRKDHPSSNTIPSDWPSIQDLELLVLNASGQFVYVAAIIRHLENRRRNPVVELQKILQPRSLSQPLACNVLPELDALYTKILHPPDVDISTLKTILHALIHGHAWLHTFNRFDALFGLPSGTTSIVICDLHSVVSVQLVGPPPASLISFHHRSVKEFLMCPARAGDLYQPAMDTHLRLIEACIQVSQQHEPCSMSATQYAYVAVYQTTCLDERTFFEDGLVRDTLPRFIEELFAVIVSSGVKAWGSLEASIHWAVTSFSVAYHRHLCADRTGCSTVCKRLKRIGRIYDRLEALASEFTQDPFSRKQRFFELLEMEPDLGSQ
ncbi:hypothetical protein H1R20_g1903, partial [Candolleomyces eurysporus]